MIVFPLERRVLGRTAQPRKQGPRRVGTQVLEACLPSPPFHTADATVLGLKITAGVAGDEWPVRFRLDHLGGG